MNQGEPSDRGIIYVAIGTLFVEEAIISAETAKSVMPEVPIHLYTDSAVENDVFEKVVELSDYEGGSGDQLQVMRATPFDRTIILDTDTYLLEPIDDIFELLDNFDIAATHNHGGTRRNYTRHEIPDSFPEYSSGVVGFRMNESILDFLDLWEQYYFDRNVEDIRVEPNQPSFRVALYNSSIRIATLPREYNFATRYPGFVQGLVRVLHGRLIDIETSGGGRYIDTQKVANKINQSTDRRVIVPSATGIRIHHPTIFFEIRKSIQRNGVIGTLKRGVERLVT